MIALIQPKAQNSKSCVCVDFIHHEVKLSFSPHLQAKVRFAYLVGHLACEDANSHNKKSEGDQKSGKSILSNKRVDEASPPLVTCMI